MYIQLTEQCNMRCEHCCVSATGKRSQQMSRDVFVTALRVALDHGMTVTIGGGEPTLHKEFETFIEIALSMHDGERFGFECGLHIVTNGKLKGKVGRLLDIAEARYDQYGLHGCGLWVEVSRDQFHDPIDPSISRRVGKWGKNVTFRTNTRIMAVGRALETGVWTETPSSDDCCCPTPTVDPAGVVWSCGCKTHRLGDIHDADIFDNYDEEYAHIGGSPLDDASRSESSHSEDANHANS